MDRNIFVENQPIKLAGNNSIRIRGRHTVVNDCLAFDWSNSGFAFAFTGTGFLLSLGGYDYHEIGYVKIIVDGVRRQRFAVVNGKEKLIIEGLSDKRHRVEVLKVTESNNPILFESLILSGKDATLNNPPFNSPRRIEFIGDSMTAGYGVLANHTERVYDTYQQDSTYSYAYLAAEQCDADARYICLSGKGIVCNCESNYEDVKAGEYYNRLTCVGGVCDDGWAPHVVVINIGTNDCCGNAKDEEFIPAAKDLLGKVRQRYKDAHIIWMYGFMTTRFADTIRDIIRELSETDKKLHFLYVDSMAGNDAESGAVGHPNVRGSIRAAKLLYKKIRSVTGWRNAVPADEEFVGDNNG